MSTLSDHLGSTPEGRQPALLLTAYCGSVHYPDDEGQWIYLRFDGDRSLILSEPEPPPGARESTHVMNSYHVTFDEESAGLGLRGSYGGVVSVSLRSRVLSLSFTAEAAAELRLPSPEVRITLDLEPSTIDEMRVALPVIFGTGPIAFRSRRLDVDG